MRLAHFIQRYPPALGGSEAYFARLSRWCANLGDEVTVFTTNAVSLEAFWTAADCVSAGTQIDAGVTIRRYPLWRMPGRRWLLKACSLVPHRLWQCLTLPCNPISFAMWRDVGDLPSPHRGRGVGGEGAAPAFDAVHASAFPYAFPIACAWRLARTMGVPFFITPFLHLGDPDDPADPTRRGYTSAPLAWLLKEADAVFVQTPSERNLAITLGVPADRVILHGLGVDPRECTGGHRTEARRRWNIPDDAVVVGHLANNSWEKGTNDLLQAIDALWRQGRPMHVLLAGPEMPNFRRFMQRFETRGRVQRLGSISDADKRDFYAAIDVFALPSRSDSFGLVLLEAWANGVANIAYRAGGPADIIRHDIDGVLVPCGDIGALALALQRLHDDVDLRIGLGMDGRSRLPSEFCWDDKLAIVRNAIKSRIAGTEGNRLHSNEPVVP